MKQKILFFPCDLPHVDCSLMVTCNSSCLILGLFLYNDSLLYMIQKNISNQKEEEKEEKEKENDD